jgi:alpha-tubulin suppressor-like RCC1 family protein
MPVSYPYLQYGGIWNLNTVAANVASAQWAQVKYAMFVDGGNGNSTLGLGNSTNYSSPKQLGSLTNWSSISISQETLALKTDGTLWAWGNNNFGALGLNNRSGYNSPKQVGTLTSWVNAATCYRWSAGVRADGTLWGWGLGLYGVHGLNISASQYISSPTQIGALTNWAQVGGNNYEVALKTDGTLWWWGAVGNFSYFSSPKQVGAASNWVSFAAGGGSVYAIANDSTLWGWGINNVYYILGLGTTTYWLSAPVQISSAKWMSVGGGGSFGAAVKQDGTLWVWGRNLAGEAGQNNMTSIFSVPTQVGALTNWAKVACGNQSTYAIKQDGTLWAWGNNSSGNLGFGNTLNYSSPKQVGSLTTWNKLMTSSAHYDQLAAILTQ